MRLRKPTARRSGAALVEAAFVVPVILFLLYVVFCGAIMVITVDQVDTAAREGARWASVRGNMYSFDTKQPAATPADVSAVVKAQGVTLDPNRMTVNTTWSTSNRPGNYVTVEVVYNWPGLGPFKAQQFVARSTQLVSY
jgi:Flp pilus assembly protein TadG